MMEGGANIVVATGGAGGAAGAAPGAPGRCCAALGPPRAPANPSRPCPCAPPCIDWLVQWHPEKPPFEFGMAEIPHTLDAILVSQHLVRACARSSVPTPVPAPAPAPPARLLPPPPACCPRRPRAADRLACSCEQLERGAVQRIQSHGRRAAPGRHRVPHQHASSNAPPFAARALCPALQANEFVENARRSSHRPESPEQVCLSRGLWFRGA